MANAQPRTHYFCKAVAASTADGRRRAASEGAARLTKGGARSVVFTFRLIHASTHKPQTAPKQASRPHMSGRLEPVG
eukprot:3045894-Prymnesium_polylepis.1